MGRKMKVYLPPWMRGFVGLMLALAWGVVTYLAFFSEEGRRELGLIGWGLMTALLAVVGGLVWAMASGKLPAYIIEEDDEGK